MHNSKNNTMKSPAIFGVIGAFLMLLSLALPYTTFSFTNIKSVFEILSSPYLEGKIEQTYAIILIVIVFAAASAIMAGICFNNKKVILISDAVASLSFIIISYFVPDGGLLGGTHGISAPLFFLSTIIVFACGVVLGNEKRIEIPKGRKRNNSFYKESIVISALGALLVILSIIVFPYASLFTYSESENFTLYEWIDFNSSLMELFGEDWKLEAWAFWIFLIGSIAVIILAIIKFYKTVLYLGCLEAVLFITINWYSSSVKILPETKNIGFFTLILGICCIIAGGKGLWSNYIEESEAAFFDQLREKHKNDKTDW